MITNKDLSVVNLSPVKKDYYQIWNELLDVAKKLSERWDPTSTNETDPGIVLLKVLTAVADKLNYNIDKNILEAFMPSAAQEESMRKLCEMMGYNIKYYQSAITKVKIAYTGEIPETESDSFTLSIPQFTNITNLDKDVNYVVIGDATGAQGGPFTLEVKPTSDILYTTLTCIEGELVQCESNNDNIISSNQLDDKHRYYLPETQVAENGIFIYNIDDNGLASQKTKWEKVDNLNTSTIGSAVYKFGYDSREARPYIQFPDDIDQLIKNGLYIYYIRTAGVNGNISANTLSTFKDFNNGGSTSVIVSKRGGEKIDNASEADFTILNENAAVNGSNIETITQAYDGFKKTIGTFDTLVTCRDYMNKIYGLLDETGIPLVSNAIVSDIRDDINKAITLCTFGDYGISYVDKSRETTNGADAITHFNLILYPFKTVSGINSYDEYVNSFRTDFTVADDVKQGIEDYKTIAHIIDNGEEDGNILCIKNYLKLNARITTINKVNVAEQAEILANIKEAIYSTFNMRQLDFGEEIPFEAILNCIESADTRIKNVALDEPILDTRFLVYNDNETIEYAANDKTDINEYYKEVYNKLALRNVLAGRVELFNYDTSFSTSFKEKDVSFYGSADKEIDSLEMSCELPLPTTSTPTMLKENEVIKFRAKNYKTVVTYPAYVRYCYTGSTVNDGSDYELTGDKKLYIYYVDQDGTPKYITYKYHTNSEEPSENYGDIICPSGFDLHTTTGGSGSIKAINFKFEDGHFDMLNMEILDTNEQISIKVPSTISFEDSNTSLYWIMNNATNSIEFNNGKYILQDGEYIFYTDRSKTAVAYYGTGNELTIPQNMAGLYKNLKQTVSAEDILVNGIKSIPWRQFSFDDTTNNLKISEYQYVTLTAGDKLKKITISTLGSYDSNSTYAVGDIVTNLNSENKPEFYKCNTAIEIPETWTSDHWTSLGTGINKDWKECSNVEYELADGKSKPLPSVIDGWEARSYLALNVGPDKEQLLENERDKITVNYSGINETPTDIFGPMAIKTNYQCNAVADKYDGWKNLFEIAKEAGDDSLEPFRIKTFKEDNTLNQQGIVLNNFGTSYKWTKVDIAALVDKGISEFTLQTSIPDADHYGLIMFYLTSNDKNDPAAQQKHITLSTSVPLGIFNNTDTYNVQNLTMHWWDGMHIADSSEENSDSDNENTYMLRSGINVVYIPYSNKAEKITIRKPADGSKDVSLIFSNLDLVKKSTTGNSIHLYGINTDLLGYYNIEDSSTPDRNVDIKVLQQLKEIVCGSTIVTTVKSTDNFYYNCPMDSGTVLSINPNAIDSNTNKNENLASARIWYDYNNVNNKFVISEIDADYLDKGIQIAQSSKK